ncbi:uncharacterized protein BDZ99DRAFT_463941 [Mytilinidion resinicola]|uniref:Mg2+ transporter protein n=1 Tax=Mytilinidion resinicola TaxID=574789 RepID=A0A6A6YJU1_9PEZI|nr:uncharacterized protein BDZ99DRAFT_463941 [Mytilinidion resinicola]KAF2809136.1 hypothetical protein BDZ99DRAFT_463941 [Mytilinidion resinicola]
MYRNSNGFFSFEESFDKHGNLQSYDTIFRVLVKVVAQNNMPGYTWHEMTFFSCWNPTRSFILCIGIPPSFQIALQNTLLQMWPGIPPSEPYSLHVPLVETIVAMQELSVWSVRDVVRDIEKDRQTREMHNFLKLHDLARHAIHSFESLSVCIETLGALQQQVLDLTSKTKQGSGKPTEASYRIRTYIDAQIRMLRNLLLRAQSSKERLQNEIALAYNIIAQGDSKVMTDLGKSAKDDTTTMKTIAVVTMAFLPPTFISAIFSTSFFNFTPERDDYAATWSVSHKFWIYWVFAIPLTGLTMGVWLLHHKLRGIKRRTWLSRLTKGLLPK